MHDAGNTSPSTEISGKENDDDLAQPSANNQFTDPRGMRRLLNQRRGASDTVA